MPVACATFAEREYKVYTTNLQKRLKHQSMHLFSHSQMCTGTKYANKLHIDKYRQTYTQMASGLNG